MNLLIGAPYTRALLGNVFDAPHLPKSREGILDLGQHVVLFVTLDKSGQENQDLHYNDFFDRNHFHWDSQNRQYIGTPVIQKIVARQALVHLFARIQAKISGITQPYIYCGLVAHKNTLAGSNYPVHLVYDVQNVELQPGPMLRAIYDWRPPISSNHLALIANAADSPLPASAHPENASSRLLSAEVMKRVTPEHVWLAVQQFQEGQAVHAFSPSIDYDLISDNGARLPPKAVFGVALGLAVTGLEVKPEHFKGGESSLCFSLLRAAGYSIIPKGAKNGPALPLTEDLAQQDTWQEGDSHVTLHLRRERARGLAQAKKAQFIRLHGKLVCEACAVDPVALYGTPLAESCIEVHHAITQVANMASGHTTRLDDLRCLCANCHRLEHRRIAHAGLS